MFNTIHFDENKKNGKTTSNVSLSWIKAVSGKQGILGIFMIKIVKTQGFYLQPFF